ncbi:MAG: trehalose-6-phosphate synthase [Steroidobacteraceae bacterium]
MRLPTSPTLITSPQRARRVVIVSNRVTRPGCTAHAGGLTVAIGDSLTAEPTTWFGWSGRISRSAAEREPECEVCDQLQILTTDLTAHEHAGFYAGFSNQCLWPLLHHRPDLMQCDNEAFATYVRVNQRYASTLMARLHPDDLLWVHDYHLMPLARALRAAGACQRLGFFLHVPFPPSEVIARLPWHRQLFSALLEYDAVAFQTSSDTDNFRHYAQAVLGAQLVDGCDLQCAQRLVRCRTLPAGIDVDDLARLARAADTNGDTAGLREFFGRDPLIAGIDRLDYSKGLLERFRAFEHFLANRQAREHRAVYVQVAAPSREPQAHYANLRLGLEHAEEAITRRFAEADWVPLHCIKGVLSRGTLAALYRVARVGFVTPMRDGMNLVAKEYIAAQDPDDPGVLILSEFAGAAETLREAIIVNPLDVEVTANAIQQALLMPLAERQRRHAALCRRIRGQDAHRWRRDFLALLRNQPAAHVPGDGHRILRQPMASRVRKRQRAGGELT